MHYLIFFGVVWSLWCIRDFVTVDIWRLFHWNMQSNKEGFLRRRG